MNRKTPREAPFGAALPRELSIVLLVALFLASAIEVVAQPYTARPASRDFEQVSRDALDDATQAYATQYPTVKAWVEKNLAGKNATVLPDWTKRFDRGYDTPKEFHDLDKELINAAWDACFDIVGILDARGQPTCCVCVGDNGMPVFSPIYEYWFPVSKVSNVRVKLEKPYVKKDDIENIIRPTLDTMYAPTAEAAYRNQVNWMAKVASTEIAERLPRLPYTPEMTPPVAIPTVGQGTLPQWVETARAVASVIKKDANYRNMVPENSYVYNYPHVMVEPWSRSYDPEVPVQPQPTGKAPLTEDIGVENCMEQSSPYGRDDGKYWTDDRICHWNLPWLDPKDSWAGDFPIGFQPSFNSTADNFSRTSRDRLRTKTGLNEYDHDPSKSTDPEAKNCFYKGGTIAKYMAQFEENVYQCTEYYLNYNTLNDIYGPIGHSPKDLVEPIASSNSTTVRALSNTGCGRKNVGRLVPTSDAAITRYPTLAAVRGTWIGAKLGYWHFPPDGACYEDENKAPWDDSYGTAGGPSYRGAFVWPWTELILGQESCFDPTRHMRVGSNAFYDFEPDSYTVSGAIPLHPQTKEMSDEHIKAYGGTPDSDPRFDPLVHFKPDNSIPGREENPQCNPGNFNVAADKVMYRSPDDEWRASPVNGRSECLSLYQAMIEPTEDEPTVKKFVTRHEFDDDEHNVGIIWRFFRTCPKCSIGGKRRIPGTCTAYCAPRCGCQPDGTCCCPPFKML